MAMRMKPKQKQASPAPAVDPAITDVQADTRLRALHDQLSTATVALETAHQALAEAQPAYETAKLDLERSLNRQLIGVANDGEVATAEAAVEQARIAFAKAQTHNEELERLVNTLPSAITERKQAVQAQIAVNLRGAFHAKLSKLVALVKEAKLLSDGLDEVYEQAARQLNVHDLLRLPNGTLVRAVDLGEAGGFCDEAAGLSNACVNPYLTNTRAGRNQTSMSQLWLKDAEAWLAKTPEQRAKEDQERRLHALERDIERKRRMIADEAARAKLRKLIAERDGIPLEQVAL